MLAQPWVNRILTQHWDGILADRRDNEAWMPREAPGSKPRKRVLDAFGCGHYGCALPTSAPGMVCKVSSDASEAVFIDAALKLGDWPVGIVKYYHRMELPDSHLRRPVFVTWREEAYDVGKMDTTHYAYREWSKYHQIYQNTARKVREAATKPSWAKLLREAQPLLNEWAWQNISLEDGERKYPSVTAAAYERYTGARRLAAALRICELAFEMMGSVAYATEVGAALSFYFEHGILLADVHTNNIGKVDREDYSGRIYAITDPGHAVFLPV